MESIRSHLDAWGEITEVILNALSLLFIIAGVIMSFIKSIDERHRSPGSHPRHSYFRLVFGGWLVVALELQLAADIVGTIISPSYEHLVQLAAVAVIRTFLNYFLSKELAEGTVSPGRIVREEKK